MNAVHQNAKKTALTNNIEVVSMSAHVYSCGGNCGPGGHDGGHGGG